MRRVVSVRPYGVGRERRESRYGRPIFVVAHTRKIKNAPSDRPMQKFIDSVFAMNSSTFLCVGIFTLWFATSLFFRPEVYAQSPGPPIPERRQFDFWLGRWDVEDQTGRHVGTNEITSILDGCALQEHWRGDRGLEGISINTYDVLTKQWHQTWVDDKGGTLELDGEFKDGRMILQGNHPAAQGGTVLERITWSAIEGGKVRQVWESSTDRAKTWTMVFNGIYKKKKAN